MKNNIITSLAIAGGLVAGGLNSFAQSPDARPGPAVPADKNALTGVTFESATSSPANNNLTRPLVLSGNVMPAGTPQNVVPIKAEVSIKPPLPSDLRPLPGAELSATIPAGAVAPGTAGNAASRPTVPFEIKAGNVTLVGSPVNISSVTVPLPASNLSSTPLLVSPAATALASGVVVSSGDAGKVEFSQAPLQVTTNGVMTLIQQFDAQRTQALTVRSTALEQLRTATPEQRTAIIADLQATQIQVATEQRELARELRTQSRALRDERKGELTPDLLRCVSEAGRTAYPQGEGTSSSPCVS